MEDLDPLGISQMRRIQRVGWTNRRGLRDQLRAFGVATEAGNRRRSLARSQVKIPSTRGAARLLNPSNKRPFDGWPQAWPSNVGIEFLNMRISRGARSRSNPPHQTNVSRNAAVISVYHVFAEDRAVPRAHAEGLTCYHVVRFLDNL